MPRSPEITRAGRGSFFVPRREGLVELTDLDRWIAPLLYEEASSGGAFRKAYAKADKIKIGALGNIVRQFHLHVVARLLAIALALALPGERPPRRIGERASALLPARKSPSVRGLDWRLSGARRQSAAGTGAGHHQRSADLRCRPGLPESQGRRLSSRIVAAALPAKPFANTALRRGHEIRHLAQCTLRNALLRIAPSIGFAPRARAQIWRRLRPLIGGSKTDLINSGESHPSLRTSSLAYS